MTQVLPFSHGQPWLAPLAGHSDLPLRVLCREQGAAAACTEMISAKGLVYGAQSRKGRSPSDDLLLTTPLEGFPAAAKADSPLVVQLFGEDRGFLGEATALLKDRGFEYFDLNLGCSVPKVIKTGAGAALARDMNSVLAAAKAMLKAAGGRGVGFKIRLGWRREEENYLDLGKALEDAGAAWITLHPRYASQGFTGRADWTALGKLKKRLNIPLIASGDIFDAAQALSCLHETGADTLMFARGALHNPGVFRDFEQLLQGRAAAENQAEKAARLEAMVLRHAELARAMPEKPVQKKRGKARPPGGLLKMRAAIPRYVKDLPGSRALRSDLAACRDWDEFYALVRGYFALIRRTYGEISESCK